MQKRFGVVVFVSCVVAKSNLVPNLGLDRAL